MKPGPHRAVENGVRDSDDRHTLMVCHEGKYDRNALAFRHATHCVVQSLVETVAAFGADGSELAHIFCRGAWVNHGG